jgi:hypothetical protein
MWKNIVIGETIVIGLLVWYLVSSNDIHKKELKKIDYKITFIKKMRIKLDAEMDSINVEKGRLTELKILEKDKMNLKEIKRK